MPIQRTVLSVEEKRLLLAAITRSIPKVVHQPALDPWLNLMRKIEGTDRIVVIEDHGGSG